MDYFLNEVACLNCQRLRLLMELSRAMLTRSVWNWSTSANITRRVLLRNQQFSGRMASGHSGQKSVFRLGFHKQESDLKFVQIGSRQFKLVAISRKRFRSLQIDSNWFESSNKTLTKPPQIDQH